MHFIQKKENKQKKLYVLVSVLFSNVISYAVLKLKVFPA